MNAPQHERAVFPAVGIGCSYNHARSARVTTGRNPQSATVAARTDPDLWGHVRFGLDILRDASIPPSDPYSFTSDRVWVNHEWLAEVITADAFRLAGNPGLIALKPRRRRNALLG
jgi:hypothetical protein